MKAALRLVLVGPGREVVRVFDRLRLHPGWCEGCGRVAEDLRPYLRGGGWGCFECANKEHDVMDARMAWFIFGLELPEGM